MKHNFNELYKRYKRLPLGDRSVNLEGKTWERLEVLYRTENYVQPNGSEKSMWLCYCNCGKYKPVMYCNLSKGKVSSCGSCNIDFDKRFDINSVEGIRFPKKEGIGNTKHGQNHDLLFKAWRGMIHRCYNPNHTGSKYYKGKGVVVCDHWLNYSNFLEDNENRFKEGLTLDRINTDLGYNLVNTRWIPLGDQSANTGPKHWGKVKYKGVCWSDRRGVYRVNCYHDKKYHHVGQFNCTVEAACAYDDFVFEKKGDLAWLNRDHFSEIKEYKEAQNDKQYHHHSLSHPLQAT